MRPWALATVRAGDDRHLSEDELNRYLDGDLDSAERARADAHLSHCADCRSSLADVQMLTSLLRDLPQVEVPRSFQLGPEFALPASLWDRFAALLLPMLPALGATTVALVLMLGSVTAYRLADDQPSSGPVSELAAPAATTNTSAGGPICPDERPGDYRDARLQLAAQKAPPPTEPPSRNSGDNAAADESGAGAEAPAQSEPRVRCVDLSPQRANRAGSTEHAAAGSGTAGSDEVGRESSSSPASDTTIMVAAEAAIADRESDSATASPIPLTDRRARLMTPSPTRHRRRLRPSRRSAPAASDRAWLGLVQAILAAGCWCSALDDRTDPLP